MWNFQRIICIWICCVSCMFGTTQLSTALVQAVPYEYFDDHDQSFYDLDTEQIQAKYDTRLLSQQMLPSSENLKGFHNSALLTDDGGSHRNTLEMRKQNDAAFMYGSTAKLKSNDGPADGDERNNDWLEQVEETATKAASSTSAFTESLDELHLPRAASCFTNGQKYTHGQKVPRLDNCEVCLCMDGEIFCWWEKCDKKAAKTLTTYDDYSTPFEESSTTRMQLSPKTTFKSTLKPMKKSKTTTTTTNEDYKYDDDDSAEIREMQQEYEGLKEQLAREEHAQEREREQEQEQEQEHEEIRMHEQHKNHNKQMLKKKIYQQQEEEKYNNKKIKEENQKQKQKQKQEMEPHRTQEQQKLKPNEHYEQHHHARNHNGNNRHRDNGSSGASSSKILNFPENLPSVLYYDYKTEEHHQHQHQHREQHLKHQKQKQQQHEKELKQRQQQKLLQKQQTQQQQKLQTIQRHHSNRHHEYGQVFHAYTVVDKSEDLAELGNGDSVGIGVGSPSTTFKYFSNGNENIYNGGDLLSDSDILPEPPTKKPKILIATADTTDMAKTTGTPLTQIYRLLTAATAVTTMPSDKSLNTATTIMASTPLKKEILSSWDSNKPNNDKTNGNNNSNNNSNSNGSNSDSKANRNNESTEDLMDTDDQDDAFHRWLTAPDTNNKNYFTFNESTSMDGMGGLGGFDGTNSDYNGDEKNYENIGFDSETGFSSASASAGDTKKTMNVMATGATKNIETAAASIYSSDAKVNGMHENEQHFSVNNVHNGNGNGNYINMANSNGIINGNGNSNSNNNNIVSPFSQSYENFNRNNNLFGSSTTSTSSGGNSNESGVGGGGGGGGVGIIGSTISNEDNGVASVVNIDIMLTASSAELQQQQPQSTANIQTTNQQQQQQQQEQYFEHEKQIGKTPNEFMQPPSVLISNKNDGSVVGVGVGVGALVKNNSLSSNINDNSNSNNSSNNNNNNNKNFTNILGGYRNLETQNMGSVNLSNNNSNGNNNTNTNTNNNNSATSYSSSSSSDSFKFKHLPTVLVSQTNATSSTATATALVTASAIPPTLSTTSSPERQCNVMGTLYKIGDVLPQDTGNCLQCICIDGSTSDDTPRVTCSPHNCPPLVLPDLFDATGY